MATPITLPLAQLPRVRVENDDTSSRFDTNQITNTKLMVAKVKEWGAFAGSMLTLLTVLTLYASDRAMLLRHEGLISAYEQHGTPAVVTLRATYDERLRATDARLDKLEAICGTVADMRGELKSMNLSVLMLNKSFDEHRTKEEVKK